MKPYWRTRKGKFLCKGGIRVVVIGSACVETRKEWSSQLGYQDVPRVVLPVCNKYGTKMVLPLDELEPLDDEACAIVVEVTLASSPKTDQGGRG